MNIDLPDADATEALGGRLADLLAPAPGGWLVTLDGSLGAGKTTLARGFLRALGYSGRVPSPTYTLVEPYEAGGRRVLHMDLYRLSAPEELEYLGFRDAFAGDAIVLIEWPERAGSAIPAADISVSLGMAAAGRSAAVVAHTERGHEILSDLID
jgi:tRNA threonylcarbamoyladenosine biosynthesis protein TsaE